MAERRNVTRQDAACFAAMVRNYLEDDEALAEAGSVVVQMPGDPLTLVVFQKGGDHLMVQVNAAEVVIR